VNPKTDVPDPSIDVSVVPGLYVLLVGNGMPILKAYFRHTSEKLSLSLDGGRCFYSDVKVLDLAAYDDNILLRLPSAPFRAIIFQTEENLLAILVER
jgi:hypothetical protein